SKTPSASPTAEQTVSNTDTVDVTPDYSGSLLYYLTDDGAFSTSYLEQQRSASASPTPTETIDTTKTPDPSLLTASPEETALNANAMSSSDILDSVNRLVPEGLTLLSASDGQNRDELVVTAATAAKYQLQTIDDLAKYCGKLNFGVPSEFQNRPYGAKALAQYYQCKPQKFTVIDDQDKLSDALASNQVQVANVFSASSTIDQNAYKVLEDPSGIFIPQQIVPVVRDNELPDSAKNAINTVSTQISTDDLKNFDNLTHGSEAMSPSDVATFWIDHSTE
ncbi:MAG: glycine betaine ABC transporter substrate-binding protein, partial [Rothia sp. (in: high G+C Gram-positive bacteria)]|nr:glycine betaine ABC transporter substrate-binding protein [Rothia sp. (in: high G+C Gram-positive bacteria)]